MVHSARPDDDSSRAHLRDGATSTEENKEESAEEDAEEGAEESRDESADESTKASTGKQSEAAEAGYEAANSGAAADISVTKQARGDRPDSDGTEGPANCEVVGVSKARGAGVTYTYQCSVDGFNDVLPITEKLESIVVIVMVKEKVPCVVEKVGVKIETHAAGDTAESGGQVASEREVFDRDHDASASPGRGGSGESSVKRVNGRGRLAKRLKKFQIDEFAVV
ncbi:hypothetical protein FRC12_011654 [Ceratobasidium sp. 428]|nr:hypothetical protein FRC12_011654 [Ceratobasidium sp. 428]